MSRLLPTEDEFVARLTADHISTTEYEFFFYSVDLFEFNVTTLTYGIIFMLSSVYITASGKLLQKGKYYRVNYDITVRPAIVNIKAHD